MDYRNYVIAAYAFFILALLWDFIAPRMRIRQSLHDARRQAAQQDAARQRHSNTSSTNNNELQR